MEMAAIIFVLCSFAVITAEDSVKLEEDVPFLSVPLWGEAKMECCLFIDNPRVSVNFTWWRKSYNNQKRTMVEDLVRNGNTNTEHSGSRRCGTINIKSVMLNDSGLYQCLLNVTKSFTHGTYLQVYKPLQKTINLSESTKNKILTAEGILLLLFVLLPSITLLFKSKRVNELEKKKVKKEEENIYQGLNLDDCCTPYDQIERSQANGPYQDVCNIIEEEEDIQLEKP
ncbi:B-cell antigen receptor complex-associated protein alpha chain [Channa argus]|uniref:B-cell antigen receptor complex-associated protein alpha chain n=1 Tax=Channa argus TaxID=215402 RepID=A0A6G1PPD3_CHAAH|nr:B-cell antigen receptor complex-associated protein alpha chain [Channa argus]KAK2910027.1 hypothetical protein Q8A73_007742 [Channa argus]